MIPGYHMHSQDGDYVIYSRHESTAPYFVKMAGDEMPLSTHWTLQAAREQVKIYQRVDKKRRA